MWLHPPTLGKFPSRTILCTRDVRINEIREEVCIGMVTFAENDNINNISPYSLKLGTPSEMETLYYILAFECMISQRAEPWEPQSSIR